jgi:hypothetical protein
MLHKTIHVELIVPADEAEEVVPALNSSLDHLDLNPLSSAVRSGRFEHRGTRKKSALAHTIAAGSRSLLLLELLERVSWLRSTQSFEERPSDGKARRACLHM